MGTKNPAARHSMSYTDHAGVSFSRPDLINFEKLKKSNAKHNLENAFTVADRQLGITQLLDPEGKFH